MALVLVDSWDHYATADMIEKWFNNVSTVVSAGNGMRGTASCRMTSGQHVRLSYTGQSTWILGFAWRFTALPASDAVILRLIDGTTDQVQYCITSTGAIVAKRGTATVIGTTSNTLSINTYAYVELRTLYHSTAGEIDIVVDGVSWLHLTGVNTQNTATTVSNNFRLGQNSGGSLGTVDMDDFYLCDGTGSAPYNTLLGVCAVDALFPTGDGSLSAWTPSTGTAHYAVVDEAAPNDDTDYLSTATNGLRDLHTFANLPGGSTRAIVAIQHTLYARREAALYCEIISLMKSGGTTALHSSVLALVTAYDFYTAVWRTDPATGLAWTASAVDALEAGFEAGSSVANVPRVTQHVLEVLSIEAPAAPAAGTQPHVIVVA